MKIYITTPIIERAEKTYQEKLNGALERINSIKGHFKAAHGVQIVDVVTCITEEKISPSEPDFEALMMGMKFSDYIGKSRKRDGFYARMIFVHHCRAMKMKLTKIAQYVHRDHSSMLHILKKYGDDMRFNPQFREFATKVNDILNKNNNAQI